MESKAMMQSNKNKYNRIKYINLEGTENSQLIKLILSITFTLMIINYFLSIFIDTTRTGLINSIIMTIAFTLLINKFFQFKYSKIDLLMILFIIWSLASVTFYTNNNLPISVFLQEFSTSIFPILFYFIARLTWRYKNHFYKSILYSSLFTFIIGFYLHYTLPSIYIEFLYRNPRFYLENFLETGRFASFLSSTTVGSIGVVSSFLSLYFAFLTKRKLYYIFYLICLFAVLISYQRSAILALIVFSIVIFIMKINLNKIPIKFFRLSLFVIPILIIVLSIYFIRKPLGTGTIGYLIIRLQSIPSAISERSDQWFNGFTAVDNIFFGTGLGAVSHKAMEYSNLVVLDGNYFKLIYEHGLFGFSILSIVFLFSVILGFKNIKSRWVEITILLTFMFQAIGSNVISLQVTAPIFWFIVGVLVSKDKMIGKK